MQLCEAFFRYFVITLWIPSNFGLCGEILCGQETLWDKIKRRGQAFFVVGCCFFGCFCLQEGLFGPKTWFLEFNSQIDFDLNYKTNSLLESLLFLISWIQRSLFLFDCFGICEDSKIGQRGPPDRVDLTTHYEPWLYEDCYLGPGQTFLPTCMSWWWHIELLKAPWCLWALMKTV